MNEEDKKKGLSLASFNPFHKKGNTPSHPLSLTIVYADHVQTIDENPVPELKNPQTPLQTEELEEQKKGLITDLIKRLKIKSLTPYGIKKVKDILENSINFNDPEWQKDIKDYFNVTDEIENAIGTIRDYGASYFKDNTVPPSVYTTALAIEFPNISASLPYAEKKIYKGVNSLIEKFGQSFEDEKPQVKVVFLNHIKNRIDNDLNTYLGNDGEQYHADLEQKFLHFYSPIAKNLTGDTPFEQKIKEYIAEIEQVLDIPNAPKAEIIKMNERTRLTEKNPEKNAFDPTKSIVAQTKIKPEARRNHILFQHNDPEDITP